MKNQKQKTFHIIGGETDCDDCEVCKAVAQAEKEGRDLSFEELTKAMEEQGKKDGMYFYKDK
jgi:hypothetical protein